MIFSVAHPKVFLLTIPLLLCFFYVGMHFDVMQKALLNTDHVSGKMGKLKRMKACFWTKTIFRFLAGLMFIASMSDISFGTKAIPVQKAGSAVCLVFDISYSMETPDGPDGLTRLQAAASYAENLLPYMKNTKISVVLAKGEGMVAVPLTEDVESIQGILECLSPKLMTSAGTSLGGGIKSAISSFPNQISEKSSIWVFTDCEETDKTLQNALSESFKHGISVTMVGFGSENESEIFTGDGSEKVKTALRSTDVEKIISAVKGKLLNPGKSNDLELLNFIKASDAGSATRLLKTISNGKKREVSMAYEIQTVRRYRLFIGLALVFFILSFVFGELDIQGGMNRFLSSMGIVLCLISFTGCTPRFKDGTRLLESKISWSRNEYQESTVHLLRVLSSSEARNDSVIESYALYGLGATYLMQGEKEAAMKKFTRIYDTAPDELKFAILYNSGIIAHRNGDYESASDFFRQALLIDDSNTNAKINLELSLREENEHARENVQDFIPISEDRDQTLENELFSIIKEGEQNQWKSRQKESERTSQDY